MRGDSYQFLKIGDMDGYRMSRILWRFPEPKYTDFVLGPWNYTFWAFLCIILDYMDSAWVSSNDSGGF